MKFIVTSTPQVVKPSTVQDNRRAFRDWMKGLLDSGVA